jgi:dephospho-CoA kinase
MLLAVTGGIATGKSTVSRILEELGAPLIDFDLLARQVVEPGKPAWKEIVDYFGKEVVQEDGRIDRKRLSEVVFQDVEKRKKLEGITHPRIFEEFDRQVKEIASKDPDAIIQAGIPLLIELDLQPRFDQVLVVYAPQETQIDRLMKRDRISREAAKNILKAQMPIDEKLRLADFVIHNEGSLEETRKQVEAVWQELKKMRKKNTEDRSQESGARRTTVERRSRETGIAT